MINCSTFTFFNYDKIDKANSIIILCFTLIYIHGLMILNTFNYFIPSKYILHENSNNKSNYNSNNNGHRININDDDYSYNH